jgi:hypothetical protein
MPQGQTDLPTIIDKFNSMTRMVTVGHSTTLTKPTGGGTTSWQIPPAGILKGIRLYITGSVSGTITAPNAFGFSSVVRRIRLVPNIGNIIMDFSGMGYHWLLRDSMDEYYNAEIPIAAGHGGRDPVAATTFDISLYIPVMLNQREPVGVWMLQNLQSILTLYVDWEADATVATGATVTATAVPTVELLTVPDDYGDGSFYRPLFQRIHSILEEQESVAATGDYVKTINRLGTFLQIFHGINHGLAGSDPFTHARLRMNQTNWLDDLYPDYLDFKYSRNHGNATRPPGTIQYDFMEQSGLFSYSNQRDTLDSTQLTDLASVITVASTATVPVTLYTMRRAVYVAR